MTKSPPNRDEEKVKKMFFRSSRVFRKNGQIYFSTREGVEMGPFQNMDEVEWEVAILIRNARLGIVQRPKLANSFKRTRPVPFARKASQYRNTGEKFLFRSPSRAFRINGEFFVSTREDTILGPFLTLEEAEGELLFYKRRAQSGHLSKVNKTKQAKPVKDHKPLDSQGENMEAANEFVFRRPSRIFRANDRLYVSTREGTELGPFKNLREASVELAFYIREHRLKSSSNERLPYKEKISNESKKMA